MWIEVKFKTRIPDTDIPERDISEWLAYELKSGAMSVLNTMGNKEVDATDIEWRKI